MIKKIIDKHLEKMAEEVLKFEDKKIKDFIRQTGKEGAEHEHQVDFMKSILAQVLIAPEEEWQQTLYEGMEQFLDALAMHRASYKFHVELKDPVIQSSRDFCVPGFMMISDLAYAVMAAFDIGGSHLFQLNYKNECFMVNDEEWESMPADLIPLGALELRKGSTLKMEYDFGEGWDFVIKCSGRKKVDFAENIPMLENGDGYNLWEDNRHLLYLLIENPHQSLLDVIGEDVTVQECAEDDGITLFRDDQKEDFMRNILDLKVLYERNEEEEDDLGSYYQA